MTNRVVKVWRVVVDGKCCGVFTGLGDASRVAKAMAAKNSWSQIEVVEKGTEKVVRRTLPSRPKPTPAPPKPRVFPKPRIEFKEPTGQLKVPAGTLVVVYRNVYTKKKLKGWVKYKLKNERTFFECHQVTTMNQGLLEAVTIKTLTGKGWMVFHTEDPNYPLIAFSAYTKDFPMKEAHQGIRGDAGMLPDKAFPFHSPLKYPPNGNTFERLFNEQKNAFLYKAGFDAGAKLRKKKAEKQLDSDES